METCWTIVERAAAGDGEACGEFAQTYLGIVRNFLGKHWRGSPNIAHLEDAVQEVFLDLFRANGALTRFDRSRGVNFRTFLFGVAHKVALRHEERIARNRVRDASASEIDGIAADAPTASRVFDREWARTILARARDRQTQIAQSRGQDAEARVELLRLRFSEGLPIREIAARWQADPAKLHHEYAKARDEFKQALRAEIGFHLTGTAVDIERECRVLLELLSQA